MAATGSGSGVWWTNSSSMAGIFGTIPPCKRCNRAGMDFTTIAVSTDAALGRLELNRPEKLNPLSTTTLLEIAAAARWFDEQPAGKVVVVEGRGRAFSAGADLAAFAPGEPTADGLAATLSQRDAADA